MPDRLIVKFAPDIGREKAEREVSPLGGTVETEYKRSGVMRLNVPSAKIPRMIAALTRNPNVEFVEYDYIARIQQTPNDPLFSSQGYLSNIQVPQAWDITTGAISVTVAVLDTGVDANHPDLAGKVLPGWNFVANTNNAMDDNGHGTHVAGIIGANGNNNQGIAGISWGARLLPIKVLDNTGVGTYSQVAEGIIYATDNGARVINLSLGGPSPSQVLANAVQYAQARGVLVVAAVGDSAAQGVYYPAALPDVIAVGATDSHNQLAAFSSFGDRVDVVAPGVNIASTGLNGSYARLSGTSMSAAHVSGVAALLAGQPQFDTAPKIRSAILATTLDLGAPGRDAYFGMGLIQAASALTYTGGITVTPTLTPTVTPTPWDPYVGMLAPMRLWGTAQTATNCTVTNGGNAIDLAFNNAYAACAVATGQTTGNWTMSAISDVPFTTIGTPVTLDAKFYRTGTHTDDTVLLQVSNDGTTWNTLETFNATNLLPTTAVTRTYNVSAYSSTQAQVNGAQVRFSWTRVGTTTDAITYNWDEVRLNVPTTAQNTPTIPARPATRVPGASDPHVAYTPTTDSCAGCHRSHTGKGSSTQNVSVLRATWPEENVCFTCHTTTGNGTNVQPAFTTNTNTATRFFKHDVAATNGVHRVNETGGSVYGGANRHVECEDCHQPHEATRDGVTGSTKAPMIQPVMNAMSGVDPMWTGAGAPFAFTWMNQAQREYQVCFKCHSSYTTLPTYQPDGYQETSATTGTIVANGLAKLTSTNSLQVPDMRDLAQAFNPNNASYHPVVAKGKNTWANGFVTGWNQNSMVYCSDCHTNANPAQGARGPHGSPRLHLLDGAFDYVTVMPNGNASIATPDNQVCFKCHSYAVYVQNTGSNSQFRYHAYHNGGQGTFGTVCYACHNSHGSEQLHLINFDTTFVTPLPGYNSQSAWVPNGAGHGTCYLTCHTYGGDSITHNGWSY